MSLALEGDLTIKETDEIGTTIATYVYRSSKVERGAESVEVISPPQPSSTSYITSLLNVFLPAGYPHSVTEDYLETHSRHSQAQLQASYPPEQSYKVRVGVGDATASPTAALLLNVLQESMGRIATILFAHRLGTSLEPECKMYRLAADILNDSAMVLDCLSPAFPKPVRVGFLSLSSVLRALCGVAAGSSKASLSAHFARWGNLGELNAKDSSQETIISLIGMLVGSVVVSYVSSPLATWIALLFLLAIHLATNHAAVRAVNMTTLNRQRANIVFSALFDDDQVLTPAQASKEERIFESDGVLRWRAESNAVFGKCRIGVSLDQLLSLLQSDDDRRGERGTASNIDTNISLPALIGLFKDEEYILYFSPLDRTGTIVLKAGVGAQSQLKAWSHALLVSRYLARTSASTRVDEKRGAQDEAFLFSILKCTLQEHSQAFDDKIRRLRQAGWETDTASLETRPGRRVYVCI
ncbi:uncharacterized protein GIQ15_01375 [Arthroderma uncinatum]|uniref:uncharacterized protein n=1 Tax=Arthroderma uncinatum TaxID=74035 RepID=UPI00144ABFEB|nr:uncharacterized protein GIQ15_01375 [Arthroderma uncinatum]KAF3491858.1 hypothetical protein GIQ15_01375 [Arthroderma uncinatum]